MDGAAAGQGRRRWRFRRDLGLVLRNARARRIVLASPALFSVVVRWLAWLESLAFVLLGDLRPENRQGEPWLLFLTFGVLALYTLYVPLLRGLVEQSRLARAVEHGALLSTFDVLLGLLVIAASGGWGSPHYRFGMTATILPSLRFGWRGALLAAGGFSLGYLLIISPRLGELPADSVIGTVVDPFLVALFCAYLSGVMRGLREEQVTTDRALRETAALYDLACAVLPAGGDARKFVGGVVDAVRGSHLYRSLAVDVTEPDAAPPRPIRAGFDAATDAGHGATGEATPRASAGAAGPALPPAPFALRASDVWVVPVRVQGEPVGEARFAGLGPGTTPAGAARLAEAITAQIAVGLEHARLSRRHAELVAEEERDRIARDIHDGIAQHLYMLTLSLEACVELAGRGGEDLGPRLAQLLALSKQALWEVRHYIYDLKPMLSGDYSFTSTVRNQLKEWRTISGLAAELTVEGEEPPLPVPLRAALYRIVQEALANVFKHARATKVAVAVHYGPDGVALTIDDDGVGLPADAPSGFGLGNMRDRAAEVGGDLTLANRPTGGLHLHAFLPLEGETP